MNQLNAIGDDDDVPRGVASCGSENSVCSVQCPEESNNYQMQENGKSQNSKSSFAIGIAQD